MDELRTRDVEPARTRVVGAVWAACMVGLSFSVRWAEVGVHPGHGYPGGQVALIGLALGAGAALSNLLPRASQLLQLSCGVMAAAAYMSFRPGTVLCPTHLLSVYLVQMLLPATVIASVVLVAARGWSDLTSWSLAALLSILWEPFIDSLSLGHLAVSRYATWLRVAEVALMGLVFLPPSRWRYAPSRIRTRIGMPADLRVSFKTFAHCMVAMSLPAVVGWILVRPVAPESEVRSAALSEPGAVSTPSNRISNGLFEWKKSLQTSHPYVTRPDAAQSRTLERVDRSAIAQAARRAYNWDFGDEKDR